MYEEGGSKKYKGVQVLAKVPKQMQNGIKKGVWGGGGGRRRIFTLQFQIVLIGKIRHFKQAEKEHTWL